MQKNIKIVNIQNKNYIVVDNEAFDWEIEPGQLKCVEVKIKNDPLMKDKIGRAHV